MTDHDLRPPQTQSGQGHGSQRWLWGLLLLVVLAVGAWYGKAYWDAQHAVPQPPAVASQPPQPEDLQPVAPMVESTVIAPAQEPQPPVTKEPLHPLTPAHSGGSEEIEASVLDRWVVEWLGKPALQFLVMPRLADHVVATIDNLPRSHAAPRLWPLSPVGGKMVLQEDAQGLQIAPQNSQRYDALVNFVTGIDPAQAAVWYRQAYPLLQQSYENLGYPGQYFNDRLVEVIDHLLLTPEPVGPIAVKLVQVQGNIAPEQPWLRYEFADEGLEQRSAGQKILLRLGAEHRQRLKAYLQALREQVAKTP